MMSFTVYFVRILGCLFYLTVATSLGADELNQEIYQTSSLDLDTAVYRALTYSLNLEIARKETSAKHGLMQQASLYPNPVMSYELEDYAGNNQWRGWNHREERYIWTQLFETAGKRYLRTQAAAYQYYAAMVGYDVTKLIILNRLNRAFISAVAAQEQLKVSLNQAEIAQEVLRIATKKVESGKVSLIHQNKAEVAYSAALIAVEKARVEFKNSKKRLSLLWAQSCPDFDEVDFPFFQLEEPVALESCLAELCNQAEIVQSLYSYLNVEKNLHLEKANRVPDVSLQVGYKANYLNNNQGLIAGVIIPIPIFNRNQGNVRNAYYNMLKTGDQGRQLWLLLETRLSILYEELLQAFENGKRIQKSSLPAATQAFELAQKGYKEGKFEYLDVLDAQRTLFEVRAEYIQTLVNYHIKKADIHYLNSQTD